MEKEMQVILEKLPETVKEAVANYQSEKIASAATGLEEFTFDKVAEYMGTMMANRRNRWKPIADGIIALKELER